MLVCRGLAQGLGHPGVQALAVRRCAAGDALVQLRRDAHGASSGQGLAVFAVHNEDGTNCGDKPRGALAP